MKAFVLISLSGKHEREMIDKLKSLPQVTNAYLLFGEWDIVAELEMDHPEQIGAFVVDNLRSNPEVKLTSSLIVAGK